MTTSKSEGEKEPPAAADAGKEEQGEAVEAGDEAGAQEEETKQVTSSKYAQVFCKGGTRQNFQLGTIVKVLSSKSKCLGKFCDFQKRIWKLWSPADLVKTADTARLLA